MKTLIAKGSIRRRLVLQLGAVAAVLSIVFFLVVQVVADRAAQDTQDNIIAASATAIADALYADGDRVTLELPYSAFSMLGSISQDRVFYRVVVQGKTLTGYDDLPISDIGISEITRRFASFTYRGETVRAVTVVRSVSLRDARRAVTVTVAQTQRGRAVISSRITATATAIAAVFFMVATGLSFWAAQAALRPINQVARSVARRGPNDLRPVEGETPTELAPLVEALNSLIGRLRVSLLRSEEFIADAAHRVRTPLATVRAQAELTHRRLNKPEHKKAIRAMIRAIDESSRSAGQLLDHAMVTFRTDSLDKTPIDLVALLNETCERLAPTADLKDIEILREFPEEPFEILGDPVLIQSALRNILDNAIKYSPDDSQITVRAFEDAGFWLQVRDQGRGFGDADLGQLSQRFSRGANVADIVGSGLGLTIADEVANAHNGRLEISKNKRGAGACISLVFVQP